VAPSILFKDLHRLVAAQQSENTRNALYDRLINKPFWIWNVEQHRLEDARTEGECCFNHIIGLPQKDGHDKPLYDYEQLVYDLMSKYQVDKVYIDGANPSFIKSLKIQVGEDADYDKVIARYRSEGFGDDPTKDMKVVPVNFNKEHKAMLGHCKMILENEGGRIAINPDKFDKLITSLRTAVDNDGVLEKESTSYNDIFDAFRLALKFYNFRDSSDCNSY
jgi:hypothetical protein